MDELDPTLGMPVKPLAPDSLNSAQDAMIRAAGEVMDVAEIMRGERNDPIRVRGRLRQPAEKVFIQLRPAFEAVGHTPLLRREGDQDLIRAIPVVFERAKGGFPTVAVLLLIATILSVFFTGVTQADDLYVSPTQVIMVQITGDESIVPFPELLPTPEVWRAALWTGVQYMLALLGILGAHEMGHYLMARYHRVQTTPPFFIPMPISFLGTMGAVIAMREPSPNRRIQFDIGVAGPLAGIIVAVPVMIVGLMMSDVGTAETFIRDLPPQLRDSVQIIHEGQSLAYLALKYLIFGEVLPRGDVDVWIHPVAFAAWAGFLVTALNLLPIGQLDGGHVMFGLFGHKARLARGPVIAALIILALGGTIREMAAVAPALPDAMAAVVRALAAQRLPGWSGWWIWIAFAVFLLRHHAPVLDEITPLDAKRKLLGAATLVLFLLIFSPTPLVIDAQPLAAIIR